MCTKEIFCWMIFHQFRYEIPKSEKKENEQNETVDKIHIFNRKAADFTEFPSIHQKHIHAYECDTPE